MQNRKSFEPTHGDLILAKLTLYGNTMEPVKNVAALTGLPSQQSAMLVAQARQEVALADL